ncbi:MAG TPA: hypothetical protein VGS03_00880 [Candidatus Polarisedimenticolia bacterium]|jgi:hypothetical protein|nr:hypothetical protein [Candidatus Polarisedimenticolia bacterium]
MTHLGADLLMGYARRTLDAEALLLADDHLSGCLECRGRLTDDDGLRATVRSMRRDLAAARQAPTSHLPYDQIEARAEGRLRGAAREVAETHLESCAPCAAQARDLERFATAFRDARPRATIAGAAAAAAGNDFLVGAGTTFTNGIGSASRAGGATAGEVAADAGDDAEAGEDLVRADGVRPTFRLSDEAAAEATRPAPSRAIRLAPATAEPGEPEERSLAATVALIVMGAAVLVGVGFGGRAAFQKMVALNGRVQELERRNETLQSQADAAEHARSEAAAFATQPSGPSGATGANATPAQPSEAAVPGQTAPVQARREVTIQDRKGAVGLDAEGDLVGFDGLPVAAGKVLASALRRGGVEVPDEIRTLATARPNLPEAGDAGAAGASEGVVTLATANGTLVRGVRPVLSWGAVEGATAYRVVLYDAGGNAIAQAGPTRNTSWTVPRSLPRGQVYQWRVVALRPADAAAVAAAANAPEAAAGPAEGAAGGPAPAPGVAPASVPRGAAMERIATGAARFKVLGQEDSTAFERGLRAAPGSRLVAGVLAARAGLLDDAERELRALATDNPDSDVVRGLLASVEAARIP